MTTIAPNYLLWECASCTTTIKDSFDHYHYIITNHMFSPKSCKGPSWSWSYGS